MRLAVGLALGVVSGVCLRLSFPPVGWHWLAFVALVPAFWARHRLARTRVEAAVLLAVPFIVWVEILVWGMWPGVWELDLAPAGVGLLVFAATWVTSRDFEIGRRPSAWTFAVAWVAFEWIRSFSPVGITASFATSQVTSPALLQITSIAGPWALTFLIAFSNAAFASLLLAVYDRLAIIGAVGAALAVALTWFGGWWHLRSPLEGVAAVSVALVQPGHPMPSEFEERALASSVALQSIQDASELTDETLRRGAVDLVVWPEGLLPVDPAIQGEIGAAVRLAVFSKRVPFVVPHFSPSVGAGVPFNQLYWYDAEGKPTFTYRKHRASFGADYIADEALPRPMPVLIAGEKMLAGMLICFDLDFPDLARTLVRRGAQILIVPSDDAYPGIGSWHWSHAPLQAAMHGVPVLKADTAFGSVVTDGRGRILAGSFSSSPTRTGVRAEGLVVPARAGTFYTRTGDWFAWACVFLTVLGVAKRWREAES